jgi:hypothetical protein
MPTAADKEEGTESAWLKPCSSRQGKQKTTGLDLDEEARKLLTD